MWVALEDPREKVAERIKHVILSEEQHQKLAEDEALGTNVLTVHSAGADVKDKRIRPGATVVVDPRVPTIIVKPDPSKPDEFLLIVAESQILMVE